MTAFALQKNNDMAMCRISRIHRIVDAAICLVVSVCDVCLRITRHRA